MIFKLFKIFASNIFTFGAGANPNSKKKTNPVVKVLLVGLFLAYIIGFFGYMYIVTMFNLYRFLSASGQTPLMPLIGLVMALVMIFFFGFTSVATNYFTGNGEEQLLSMPLTSTDIFGAKFAVSFVTDAVIGVLIFTICAAIYGYNEGLLGNPLFYAGTILLALSSSGLAIWLIYFIFAVLLFFIPPLRKKSILTGIASVLIIVFVVFFSMFNSRISAMGFNSDMKMLSSAFKPIVSAVIGNEGSISWVYFFANAMNGKVLPCLVLLVLTLVIIFGLIPLTGRIYIKTLNGFSDVKTKKLSAEKTEKLLANDVHINSIFKALYWRDVKTVLREPSFFGNGPVLVFIMPIIGIVSFAIGFSSVIDGGLANVQKELAEAVLSIEPVKFEKICYFIILGFAAFTVFVANSTSLAVSSFSREGKAIYDLKAMPIQNSIIAKVKFWHAFTYVVLADLIDIMLLVVITAILKLPIETSKLLTLIALHTGVVFAISLVLIFIDMFIDTAKPKLNWENPIAAFKQNLNSFGGVMISLGVTALFVGLGLVLPKSVAGLIIIIVIFGIIAAPIGAGYFKYAEKKISEM